MSRVSPANQHTSDEREQLCWDYYLQTVAKGTPNAKQSAIKAGYTEGHANNITVQGWFLERLNKLKRREMLTKAERNLDKILDTSYETEEGIKTDVMRVVADVSKTVVTTLGKNEGYSTKTENETVLHVVPISGMQIVKVIEHEEIPANNDI